MPSMTDSLARIAQPTAPSPDVSQGPQIAVALSAPPSLDPSPEPISGGPSGTGLATSGMASGMASGHGAKPAPGAPDISPIAVMLHGCRNFGADDCHESATQTVLGQRLAGLRGIRFLGEHHADQHRPGELGAGSVEPATDPRPGYCYLVPARTVVGLEAARALGIRGEDDMFGGVVPFSFVGSKCISHPLPVMDDDTDHNTDGDLASRRVDGPAAAAGSVPEGWSPEFARRVRPHVLPGYSAFTREDALAAGRRLLADGPVRVKPGWGIGGRGQTVARDATALEAAVAALDAEQLIQCGVVLEWHLESVRTMSVGQVTVAGLQTSYCGIQGLTRNAEGESVYGGSDLMFVRGGFDALLTPSFVAEVARAFHDALVPQDDSAAEAAFDVETTVAQAIEAAGNYHQAALDCFAGFFASRCNYDVLIGIDSGGRTLTGVLEQSWRMGGASGAEIAALEAFDRDPALALACASTYERYGDGIEVPPDATIYFRGVDRVLGPMVKYARLHGDCGRIPPR